MKNRDFFYLQYDKIHWKNQKDTKINALINSRIIRHIILKHRRRDLAVFDIGFGIAFFIQMLIEALPRRYTNITIEGCDPSRVNFQNILPIKRMASKKGISLRLFRKTFQSLRTKTSFDFITAIYVFPHFLVDDLGRVARKICAMLKPGGKFILVLADEKYLENKLKIVKDLSIETHTVKYRWKKYKEVLHYTDIPKIGKLIDINREERFYLDLFRNKFKLKVKRSPSSRSGFQPFQPFGARNPAPKAC